MPYYHALHVATYQISDTLQKLEVPIISTDTCNALYRLDSGEPSWTRNIKNDMICAGFAAGLQDACQVRPKCDSVHKEVAETFHTNGSG